jgi:hypothetical protein
MPFSFAREPATGPSRVSNQCRCPQRPRRMLGASHEHKPKLAILFGCVEAPRARLIRHTRNAFAHAKMPIRFDTPEVTAVCADLQRINLFKPPEEVDQAPNLSARERFEFVCNETMVRLARYSDTTRNSEIRPAKYERYRLTPFPNPSDQNGEESSKDTGSGESAGADVQSAKSPGQISDRCRRIRFSLVAPDDFCMAAIKHPLAVYRTTGRLSGEQ